MKTKPTLDEFRSRVGSKIFSAVFTKANGEERKIVARLEVKKYLKGGELSYDAKSRNNLIVFDMEKKGYRTIPFDRLKQIKVNGEEENFDD